MDSLPWRGSTPWVVAIGLFAAGLAGSCSSSHSPTGPPGPGTPALGLTANPSDAAVFTGDSISAALLTARSSGVSMQILTPQWSALEVAPGVWSASELATIRLILAVNRSLGLRTYVNLRILDTISRNTPADLGAVAWDDAAMVGRVDALVDTLAALAGGQDLMAVAIGNEVNDYFALSPAHAAEFPAFLALYRREVGRLHTRLPGVPVGIVTTNPIANPASAWIGDSLNVTSDVILHTFYMLTAGGFTQAPPSQIESQLDAILARSRGKPVGFQEVGYASSPLLGSSAADQADAVRRFRRWLSRQSRRDLLFANWFLYTDWSSSTLRILFGYYGFSSPEFGAFLGTLGLRDTLGLAKPAWRAWLEGG